MEGGVVGGSKDVRVGEVVVRVRGDTRKVYGGGRVGVGSKGDDRRVWRG